MVTKEGGFRKRGNILGFEFSMITFEIIRIFQKEEKF